MGLPSTQKSTKDRILELESRLLLVEGQLKNLFEWRYNIAITVTGELPDTPAHSPRFPVATLFEVPVTAVKHLIEPGQLAMESVLGLVDERALSDRQENISLQFDASQLVDTLYETQKQNDGELPVTVTTGKSSGAFRGIHTLTVL